MWKDKYSYGLLIAFFMATFMPLFGAQHYLFDLVSHFSLYLVVGTFAFTLLLAIKKQYYHAAVMGALFLFNSFQARSFILDDALPLENADLKVLQINLLYHTSNHNQVLDLVKRENPDLIAFQEVTASWMDQLKSLEQDWPYHIEVPQPGVSGVALFSKVPLDTPRYELLNNCPMPLISAEITVEGEAVRVYSCHLLPPTSKIQHGVWKGQMEALALQLSTESSWIVLGDFNSSGWSVNFKNLLAVSNGQLATANLAGTWPSNFPFRIPLDHVLCSKNITHGKALTLESMDSDHLAVISLLNVTPPALDSGPSR